MTAPLSPAERATVELFDQAPDALGEVVLTDAERGMGRRPSQLGWRLVFTESDVERIVAARVAEAADAREAEVRDRVEAVLRDPGNAWWHVGGTRCTPTRAIRAALAPADNDGEANR